jgi:hypothetical protein
MCCANQQFMEGQEMRNILQKAQRSAWCLVCFCFLFIAGIASAQVDQGAITGTVTDNTGAVVPGA